MTNVLGDYFRDIQDINDKIQKNIFLIKDEFQYSIENLYLKKNVSQFWLKSDGQTKYWPWILWEERS